MSDKGVINLPKQMNYEKRNEEPDIKTECTLESNREEELKSHLESEMK